MHGLAYRTYVGMLVHVVATALYMYVYVPLHAMQGDSHAYRFLAYNP